MLYGYNELSLSQKSSAEPMAITYEELEKGPPENPYRILGSHVPLELLIYSYNQNTKLVSTIYYPITSQDNLRSAAAQVSKEKKVPLKGMKGADIVNALDIRIVIKKKVDMSVDEVKEFAKNSPPDSNLSGMIINNIETLGHNEAELIKSSLPRFDSQKTVIFEVDRKPSSKLLCYACLGGGFALLIVGLFFGKRVD